MTDGTFVAPESLAPRGASDESPGSRFASLRPSLRMLLVDNAPLIACGILYTVLARFVALRLGMEGARFPGLDSLMRGTRNGVQIALIASGILLYLGLVVNPILRRVRKRAGNVRPVRLPRGIPLRLAAIVVVYAFVRPFMDGFLVLKQAIPLVHPFRFDELFSRMDTFVHFGIEPWRITHAVLGSSWTTALLDAIYVSWLPLGGLSVTLAAWSLNREWRARFFFSFLGTWIVLGTLVATGLSSAGPCFYGRFLQPDPYRDLMTGLVAMNETVTLTSLQLQDTLWQSYVTAPTTAVLGISAMPSIHIAFAVIIMLALGARSRWLFWASGVYAFLVLISTVHLGWHYAIDGYLGALGACGLWWASKPLARWYLAKFGGATRYSGGADSLATTSDAESTS